jgi:hypothetical protein
MVEIVTTILGLFSAGINACGNLGGVQPDDGFSRSRELAKR